MKTEQNSQDGFVIRIEEFMPQQWRTIHVSGPIADYHGAVSRGFTPTAISHIGSENEARRWEGFNLPAGSTPHNDDGHLIALEFGGPNICANIAKMLRGFNRAMGAWKQLEGDILKEIQNTPHGQSLNMEVTVAYRDDRPEIPKSFDVTVSNTTTWTNVLQRHLAMPTFDAIAPALYPASEQRIRLFQTAEQQIDDLKQTYIENGMAEPMYRQFATTSTFSVDAYVDETGFYLGWSGKPRWPAPDKYRSLYTVLDYITLANLAPGDPAFSTGLWGTPNTEFTPEQKHAIIQYNRYKNDYLKSDAFVHGGADVNIFDPAVSDWPENPLSDYDRLNELGGDNLPEVDHVCCRRQGGSCAFSNGRLISWKWNNRIEREKPLRPLVPDNWQPSQIFSFDAKSMGRAGQKSKRLAIKKKEVGEGRLGRMEFVKALSKSKAEEIIEEKRGRRPAAGPAPTTLHGFTGFVPEEF